MKLITAFFLSSVLFAQSWLGISSGYIYFGFNGFGTNGPNIFTTAQSSDGVTWKALSGTWSDYLSKPASGTRVPYQINAPDAIPINGTIYLHVATANDSNIDLVPWIIGQADATTGLVTTIAAVDWSSQISGATACYAGGWVRNQDGTIFTDSDGVHLHVPCSAGGLGNFKVYETHASLGDLTTWSNPVDLQVNQTDTIDPQAYLIGGTFYLWCKQDSSEYVTLATGTNVAGPFTMVKTGDWAGWGSGNEGPFMYPQPVSGWYLMFEAYASTHQMYYATCNTVDPTACTWSAKTPWTEDFLYRHGSILDLNN